MIDRQALGEVANCCRVAAASRRSVAPRRQKKGARAVGEAPCCISLTIMSYTTNGRPWPHQPSDRPPGEAGTPAPRQSKSNVTEANLIGLLVKLYGWKVVDKGYMRKYKP
jgi:hypothetical protein